MTRFLLVCAAGAAGTGVRYLVAEWGARAFGANGMPVATLLVNVVGCFLMGAVAHAALATAIISPAARLVLMTGFLGGLTTYSSFNEVLVARMRGGDFRAAVVYAGATLVICFVASVAGVWVTRRVTG